MKFRPLIPNALSLLRIFIALTLLIVPSFARGALLLIIIMTDFLDGFLARRWQVTSRLGTILDPIGDKVAALCLSYLFFLEQKVGVFELLMLFSRDIALLFFTLYLLLSSQWKHWTIQSFFFGKLATLLQAQIFLLLCYAVPVPQLEYIALGIFGVAGFVELSCQRRDIRPVPPSEG